MRWSYIYYEKWPFETNIFRLFFSIHKFVFSKKIPVIVNITKRRKHIHRDTLLSKYWYLCVHSFFSIYWLIYFCIYCVYFLRLYKKRLPIRLVIRIGTKFVILIQVLILDTICWTHSRLTPIKSDPRIFFCGMDVVIDDHMGSFVFVNRFFPNHIICFYKFPYYFIFRKGFEYFLFVPSCRSTIFLL